MYRARGELSFIQAIKTRNRDPLHIVMYGFQSPSYEHKGVTYQSHLFLEMAKECLGERQILKRLEALK